MINDKSSIELAPALLPLVYSILTNLYHNLRFLHHIMNVETFAHYPLAGW